MWTAQGGARVAGDVVHLIFNRPALVCSSAPPPPPHPPTPPGKDPASPLSVQKHSCAVKMLDLTFEVVNLHWAPLDACDMENMAGPAGTSDPLAAHSLCLPVPRNTLQLQFPPISWQLIEASAREADAVLLFRSTCRALGGHSTYCCICGDLYMSPGINL